MKTTNRSLMLMKALLGNDLDFTCKYLLVLYEAQTVDEQKSEQSTHKNHIGFNSSDAPILTPIAEALRAGEHITKLDKQEVFSRMPKYANQLLPYISNDDMDLLTI